MKLLARLAPVFLFAGLFSLPVFAQDRAGFIGESVSIPYRLSPNGGRGDATVALDLAYFFEEALPGILSWEFGLEGAGRKGMSVGGNWLFRLYSDLKPYAGVRFLYSFDPSNELGWRALLGLEWNMKKLTRVDNLRLSGETGASGFFLDAGENEYLYDILRIGVAWSY